MFNLTLFKPKGQEIKDRVLKNREALLDIMAKNVQGARQCPYLMGNKCLGQMCELFMEFRSFNNETNQSTSFWRCAVHETPILLIEQNQILRNILNELLLPKGE